jgi:tetratricopeptide (TPR) repeat protein
MSEALRDAEREARRALELDATLFEAHAALGQLHAFRGEWLTGEAHFEKALSAPGHDAVTAVIYCTCLLLSVGHVSRAERLMREAQREAPASLAVAMCRSLLHCLKGDDAAALDQAVLSVALGNPAALAPIPQIRARVARRSGRHAEARRYIMDSLNSALRALGAADVVAQAYQALDDAKERGSAASRVRELADASIRRRIDPAFEKETMVWCALLGEVGSAHDVASAILETSSRDGTVGTAWDPVWLPEMLPFRRHARFDDFVARLRLPEYWREKGFPDGCRQQGGKWSWH